MVKKTKAPTRLAMLVRARLSHAVQTGKVKSARDASLKATGGKNADIIRNILDGKSVSPRGDTLARLARVLDIAPEELMRAASTEAGQFQIVHLSTAQKRGIVVLGEVAAGVWHEVPMYGAAAAELEERTLPILPDHRYPADRQFGVIVRGESINKIARDGDYLVCLSTSGDISREIRDGDLVVLERLRPEGFREVTVKRAKRSANGWEFLHESTDPRFQGAIRLNDGLSKDNEGIEVSVIGIVLWTMGYVGPMRPDTDRA